MTDGTGILDTNVVIAASSPGFDLTLLPEVQLITAVTLGELSAGPLVARSAEELRVRQARLQMIEELHRGNVLPYDAAAARIYGGVYADVATAANRSLRRRIADLQIAAIAILHRLPLYTINVADFRAIRGLQVVPLT